jgi:hypothetical protein
MTRVTKADRDRVEMALASLRLLAPFAEEALAADWGAGWPGRLRDAWDRREDVRVTDVRDMLRLLGDGQPNPASKRFPLIAKHHARRLRAIANAARHDDDPHWQPSWPIEAEQLSSAILICAGQSPTFAYAAVRGHHQEVFRLEVDGTLRHRWWPNGSENWSEWATMESPQARALAATSPHSDALHLFLCGIDGRVERRSWQQGRGWGRWETLPAGGQSVSGPLGALSREPNHLEVFAIGEEGDRVHRWGIWQASRWQWSDWQVFAEPPTD